MQQLDYRRSMRTAQDFLTRCFAPGESIALLLRRETPASATQRIVLLQRALAPRYLGLARARELYRSQHLCCCQSASHRHARNAPKKASLRCGIYI